MVIVAGILVFGYWASMLWFSLAKARSKYQIMMHLMILFSCAFRYGTLTRHY